MLLLAASAGYDALISADKNMSYQQNEAVLPLSVVVLHVYRLKMESLIPLVPKAVRLLENLTEPAFLRVDADPDVEAGTSS